MKLIHVEAIANYPAEFLINHFTLSIDELFGWKLLRSK